MIEVAVSVFVAAIIGLIARRYKSVFCLPFFWAAFFAFLYLGLLQIRAQTGGSSYIYGAIGFGMFFLGLLAADVLFLYRAGAAGIGGRRRHTDRKAPEPGSITDKQPEGTKIKLVFPMLPLNVGLFVSLLAATFVTFVFFAEQGIPVFSSFPALAWVQSTSGVVNRLMSIFGPSSYASLGLVAWAVHRETGSPTARALMYLGLGLSILSQALLATKSAAIMIFVWFNILLYYMNKKRELRKTLLPLIMVVVPMSAAIVAIRLMSTQGYWQTANIYQTYYHRLTTIAAEPMDFVFKYMNRFGPMHGRGLHMEMARIKDQLTGQPRTPVLSEFVYNLMNNMPPNRPGLSVTLTLQGTGYIEWGMAGLLLYSFLQGLGFGLIHRYLLRKKTINLISLLFWGGVISYLITVSMTGIIFVGLEGIILAVAPPIALLLIFSAFFLLPMARRYRTGVGRKVSSVPQM